MTPAAPVFVIDDEEAVRAALGKLLRAIGVASEMFSSAQDFLERYNGDRGGCLLVDIRMPGMSGLDLLEELHRRDIHLPAIVMTGHTEETSLERLERLRPIGFLEKPFTLDQLKQKLARWHPTEETPSADR
ncbi:MAG TPA: response regulator [Vicinamibacterales bacterium]|nr:response regulator [Vicinamibacterales bacterium]